MHKNEKINVHYNWYIQYEVVHTCFTFVKTKFNELVPDFKFQDFPKARLQRKFSFAYSENGSPQ
ncbi:hypothetical protein CI610_03496 [invertebrate metagenome]|uniref:Uncharacterized protein n=1 Tax=invertebrate metagenome TaxID=1711999 RepID=A0A2H9T310_9ZZZZ